MLENVQVKFNLTILKPIHAGWLVEFYNHMTTDKGCNIIKNGWKATGITDAIRLGLNDLPSVILSMKWILCCSSLLYLPIKINLWRFQELLLTKFKWDILTPPKIIHIKVIRNGKILNKKRSLWFIWRVI